MSDDAESDGDPAAESGDAESTEEGAGPDGAGADEAGADEAGADEAGPDGAGPDGAGPDGAGPDETGSAGNGTAQVDDDAAPVVDEEEVRHVASLARVDLEDDEVEAFAAQFADILADFEELDEVPEVEREADLVNVMRPDEVREGLSQEEALANAPESEDGFFKGPRVS